MMAATSGMSVEEMAMNQISENLAHADEPAYKSSEAWFSALNSGLGAVYGGTRLNLTQGKMMKSGGPFDLALDGPGFFKAKAPSGDTVYTRLGDFHRNEQGQMVNGQGCILIGVSIPANSTKVDVHEDGRILGTIADRKDVPLGQIELYRFPAPDQLRQGSVKGMFFPNHASGAAVAFKAGDQTKITFGMLEKSNISIIESMLSLLTAQRAYEANSKGVQAADEMLRIANNLQRQ